MGITIEAGKFYTIRNGQKARVYATDGKPPYIIHGAILSSGNWKSNLWSDGGFNYSSKDETQADIIGPWIDKPIVDWSVMPKWAKTVVMNKLRTWYWTDDPLPAGSSDHWLISRSNHGVIPQEFHPRFDGDWRVSLVKRPTP